VGTGSGWFTGVIGWVVGVVVLGFEACGCLEYDGACGFDGGGYALLGFVGCWIGFLGCG